MSAKPTIVVVVLAVIGSAAAMYVLRTERQSVPRLDQPALLITQQQLPIDAVTRITLRRADDPPMVFERTGRSWTQTEPSQMGRMSVLIVPLIFRHRTHSSWFTS